MNSTKNLTIAIIVILILGSFALYRYSYRVTPSLAQEQEQTSTVSVVSSLDITNEFMNDLKQSYPQVTDSSFEVINTPISKL